MIPTIVDTSRASPNTTDAGESLSVADLDYELPTELIAQHPLEERDRARLLVLNRADESMRDARITDLPDHLAPDDLLVLNDTRVIPAKFTMRRRTGGRVDGLFVRQDRPDQWLVMLQTSGRLRPGERLTMASRDGSVVRITMVDREDEGLWRLAFDFDAPAAKVLETAGETPLPPYIRRRPGAATDPVDRERYQTVYASSPGSVAAPTAGLHFTRQMFQALDQRGVRRTMLTLHVGPGTFRPIRVERLADHAMHAEAFHMPTSAIDEVRACKARGGRVVAVGTTTTRVLESIAGRLREDPAVGHLDGETSIFIYPPYRFRLVDALLTNFHLPRSTLLALVMAFAGIDLTRRAYEHAVRQHYRFFSYGDAMLIL